MEFPRGWPQPCPPADAVDASGEVFRLVDTDPPAAADMVTHFESGRLPKAPPCLRCGLSVFRQMRDATHQRQLLPKLGRFIARGVLKPEHGKTKPTAGTQPTHTTWWAFGNVRRENIFAVVEEKG